MVPTLLLLLAPHHVTVPISIRGTPSVENSPKESGAQPLAAFTYLASSKYQSQKSVPGCPRLVKPLLASSISYYNTGCPQDGASVTEQHTCPSVTTLIYSSGSMPTQLPLLGTFSLVPEPLCEANSPGHLPLACCLDVPAASSSKGSGCLVCLFPEDCWHLTQNTRLPPSSSHPVDPLLH